MGGHHHAEIPKVPDWRVYKVEDVPQLMALQKRLATRNLKDPWARNYVWLYKEKFNYPHPSLFMKFVDVAVHGFKYGLPLAILTAIAHKSYLKYIEPEHSHGHHH